MTADGRMDVEQRAVGVEDAGTDVPEIGGLHNCSPVRYLRGRRFVLLAIVTQEERVDAIAVRSEARHGASALSQVRGASLLRARVLASLNL